MASSGALSRPILVQKYGGSSVATAAHLQNVARRVVGRHREGQAVVVVVSAMGKTTDSLVDLSREVTARPDRREMDMLLHAGEIISSALLSMAISEAGVPAISFTGAQAGMRTDRSHTQARVRAVEADRVLQELALGKIVVVAGFQGVSENLEITTLGRGGSDTSAVAMAVGLKGTCEILTDVEGIYTADPRIVKSPRKLKWCSYDEMLELAILGARVLHSRSVEIARRFDVSLLVATSSGDAPGTTICSAERAKKELAIMEDVSLRGIAHRTDVVKISLVGVPDSPGIAAKVFSNVGKHDVSISLIVQAEHHGGKNDIAFLISADDLPVLQPHIDDLAKSVDAERSVIDESLATVSLVGEGVKREPGIAARMFTSLGDEKINIDLISTSNLMLTCVIPADQAELAVRSLHREFFEDS